MADTEKRFKELDRNRDGKLDSEEFPKAKLFGVIDTDHDGFISFDEARTHFKNRKAKAADKTTEKTPEEIEAESEPDEFMTKVSLETGVKQRFRVLKPAEQLVGRMVQDVSFRDIDGVEHRLSQFKNRAATVIAVTSVGCLISKRYLPTLAQLEKTYSKDVQFVFVNSATPDKIDVVRETIQSHELKAPYVIDSDESLLSAVGATSTTDCFVIDKSLTLCYRGAVDDQFSEGHSLEQPRHSLLVDALTAVLAGRTPRISATNAPGCRLNCGQSKSAPKKDKEEPTVTYHNRISRIIQSNCIECHRDGGVGPFPLEKPEDVAAHSAMITRVVNNGTMPPWFAAPSGKPGMNAWSNDRSLTAADKSDLLYWLSSDRPLGDPAEAPVRPVFTEGWQAGEPDAIVQLPSPVKVPAEGTMPYQHVVVDTKFGENKWVRGFEIQPTASSVVHHVGVFVESSSSPEKKVEEAEKNGKYLALYVPGNSWRLFPNGTAKSLPKGSRLRFQIHYAPNGAEAHDQTRLGLYFCDRPPSHELYAIGVLNGAIKIPPRTSEHKETGMASFPSDIQIISFLPHMHLRGKSFRYEAISNKGAATTLLDIPHYDCNWQLAYHLSQPYYLPKNSRIKIRGTFDNSTRNPANPDPSKTVYWGEQSSDEMLIGYIEFVIPSQTLTAKAP